MDLNALSEFFKQNISNFDSRLGRAWGIVDHMRCPFKMADTDLYIEMSDRLEDFCEENGLDYDDYDLEEIIWELP